MKNKFDFYEIVTIHSKRRALKNLNGKEGVVMGMAQDDDGNWSYAVDAEDDGWSIDEVDLVATGKFAKRSDFYDDDGEGNRVKVIVEKDGKGRIKDE